MVVKIVNVLGTKYEARFGTREELKENVKKLIEKL